MTLPFPPRKSHLSAFWLALNLAVLLAGSLFSLTLAIPLGVPVLLVTFTITAAAGLTWTEGPLFLYRAWNRAARAVARLAQWWVLAVTYYLVLAVTARAGSRLDLGPPTDSTWTAYGNGGHAGDRTAEPRAGWARRLAQEARGRERAWWLGILPLLLIVSIFRLDRDEDDVPSNVYTLY